MRVPEALCPYFVDRPIFVKILPLAHIQRLPPPTVVVRVGYPDSDFQTVAATVATPLGQQINGVEDMLYISSFSTGSGAKALTI